MNGAILPAGTKALQMVCAMHPVTAPVANLHLAVLAPVLGGFLKGFRGLFPV